MNFLNELTKELSNLHESAYATNNNTKGISMIHSNFWNILNKYRSNFYDDAKKYFIKRDEYNENSLRIADEQLISINKELNNKIKNIKFDLIIMSSVKAQLNLIGESDIDIGCLVKDLNEVKLFTIAKELNIMGFKFDHTLNPFVKKNKYYAFTKLVDINENEQIEIEVKVRDYQYSQVVVQLHDHLDNKLTEDERIILTYLKYIYKKQAKETGNKKNYKIFKTIIYNNYFYYVPGAFLLSV